jgi:hypothetical protein
VKKNEITSSLLRYPTFEGSFLIFSWEKDKKIDFLYTKKLINIKKRNISIF